MSAELSSRELAALLDRASRHDADPALKAEARARVDALFAAHQDRIYHLCLRHLGKPERAAEVAQEAMLIAWTRLADWRGDGSFYSWLYGIARFRCLNELQRRRDLLTADGLLEAGDPERGILASLRVQERNRLLREAAAAVLDPLEQEAVFLRYEQEVGIPEITAILGITEASGARGLLQRCKRKLARELKRQLEQIGHGNSLLLGSINA